MNYLSFWGLSFLLAYSCGQEAKQEEGAASNCKCAKHALAQMQRILYSYSSEKKSKNSLQLDEVIDQLSNIAHNCTRQRRCHCPEGYFKTSDGYHCLKVSRESVGCGEATHACSRDTSARLAVAKDHVRLTNLADEIRHIEDEEFEDYYWIGLSYNRTDGGIPIWTWEDGSSASYNLTSSLRVPVRKSLRLKTIMMPDGQHRKRPKDIMTKNAKIIVANWLSYASGPFF